MSVSEQKIFIADRKLVSAKKYEGIKAENCERKLEEDKQRAKKKLLLKQGWEFFYKELETTRSMRVLEGRISDVREASVPQHNLVFVARLVTGDNEQMEYHISYSICSPRDDYNQRQGIALASTRLLPGSDHTYQFTVALGGPGAISNDFMVQLCAAHLRMDITAGRIAFPRAVLAATVLSGNPDYSVSLVEIDLIKYRSKPREKIKEVL